MRSRVMMILKIARQHAAQVTLAEDDNVIQTFAADRSDETLGVGILPGRSRRGDDLDDAHRANAMPECWAIRFISVPQQIAWCRVPRKRLGHLAGKPVLRRICGDFEVNDPPAIEAEHDQGIKEPNVAVVTTNMSIAAMAGRWLRRKLRQVGEGTLGRQGIQRPTVAWLILMPSLSSSPWMRGAPHNGLALLIRRIKARISVPILGRPGRRDRQRQ